MICKKFWRFSIASRNLTLGSTFHQGLGFRAQNVLNEKSLNKPLQVL